MSRPDPPACVTVSVSFKPLRDRGWALILGHHRLLLHTHVLFPRLPSSLFMSLYRTLIDQVYSERHTCLFNPLKYLQTCKGSVQIRALPASQHALNTVCSSLSLSLSLWPVKTWRSAFSALEWRRTAPLDSDITFVFSCLWSTLKIPDTFTFVCGDCCSCGSLWLTGITF